MHAPGPDRLPIAVLRVTTLTLLFALLAPSEPLAAEAGKDLFQGDLRLQKRLTVRVSRMPIGDLLQRLGAELGVRLGAEGDDVADQRIDLFTHGEKVSGGESLTAISRLLNAECPPRGYRWERSGQPPDVRYTLVRDVASRQWETQVAAEAEARMRQLLRERFVALAREPFQPAAANDYELPSMRKLLPTLTDEQLARLCEERSFSVPLSECTPAQKTLLRQLAEELVAYQVLRWPEDGDVQTALTRYGPPARDPNLYFNVCLRGEAPRYTVEVRVGASQLGQFGAVGGVLDTRALAPEERRRPAPLAARNASEPSFALPTRSSWLMGDVLADIAARAKVNLLADDYTRDWSSLARYRGAQPLSVWLAAIREEYEFEPAGDGKFLRLRHRAWWRERQREVPTRLLTRWAGLVRGAPADRLQMLAEVARWVPFSLDPRLIRPRLEALRDLGPQVVDVVAGIVPHRKPELLLYDRLLPAGRQAVFGRGLTVSWPEIPADLQAMFQQRFVSVRDETSLRGLSIFLRFSDDLLQMNWEILARARRNEIEVRLPAVPTDDLQQLVGKPLPDLKVEETAGKTTTFHAHSPTLLYVTPAWPRPVVARQEEFADLKALARMDRALVQVLGTEATTSELRGWWKERGLEAPPALLPESARQLGVRHQPLAIVLDGEGRVTWVKRGYAPGDEAEWGRQLQRVGAGSR
jgi:hypothetical protein